VSDESSPPELRWIIERIDRNHAETTADIAKLEMQVAAIPVAMDRYVLARVYEADEKARDVRRDAQDARLKRLEDEDSSKSTGNRAWLLGLAQMVLSIALSSIATVLLMKGGH
jgi:hypothetical protein